MPTIVKRKPLFLITLILLIAFLSGCTSSNITEDGYKEVLNLSGSSDAQSKHFVIKSDILRVKYTTTGQGNGVNCQIIDKDDRVIGSFGAGANPTEDSNTYNVQPGEYAVKVQSSGMQYEIIVEEKVK